jgi:uncharacterized membrane protein
MRTKAIVKFVTTALVLSYPFLTHWILPHWQRAPAFALMLPPTILNALLAWAFGRTLMHGQEPMISMFARLEHASISKQENAELPQELVAYTRTLTKIWSGLFVVMALVSASLAWSGLHAWWALFTGLISYVLMGMLFLGEYMFRRFRFTQYPHANPFQFVLSLIKSGPIWMRGK